MQYFAALREVRKRPASSLESGRVFAVAFEPASAVLHDSLQRRANPQDAERQPGLRESAVDADVDHV